MRTTLTLDADVAAKAKRGAARLGKPSKSVTSMPPCASAWIEVSGNRSAAKPYRVKPIQMGLKKGYHYDNIGELLEQLEGPYYK